MKLFRVVKFWIINARYHALVQSLLPALLAVCLAAREETFSPGLAFLAVIGVELGHLGLNLFDDYFDFRRQNSGYRDLMARAGMRARIAKCPYLTSGAANLNQLLTACLVFCGLALLAGLAIFLDRGHPIIWLAAVMALLGLAYSGWPLRLSYRGLGEIEIGLVFGPLLMSGVFYSACGQFDPALLLIAVPVGLLVMNIVYAHAIMDLEPDQRIGKMTLAGLLGSRPARLVMLALVLGLPYVLVGLGVASGRMNPANLLVWLTLPLAAALFKLMLQYVRDPARPVERRFWMGPMNRWEVITANGIEWFMVRWYLARNLLLFFCLAIMAASIIG
ncbi:1,4-dihydroxy-2-naphthoate prenyltransferase [Deltaproteobacteria bacterium Smac51]|nr:1,4-dihydroxy-2-naphthoate prenyltransferase [Deltaproteobacteria bacterium Smac51]